MFDFQLIVFKKKKKNNNLTYNDLILIRLC